MEQRYKHAISEDELLLLEGEEEEMPTWVTAQITNLDVGERQGQGDGAPTSWRRMEPVDGQIHWHLGISRVLDSLR